jgi:hypothetical protein
MPKAAAKDLKSNSKNAHGQMRRPKSWARKAAKKKSAAASGATMRGIVDTELE